MTAGRLRLAPLLTGLAAAALLLSARDGRAFPQFVEQAKAFGAKDCTFCHSTPRGMTGWNKRGQWLIKTKLARKADRIDVQWLKEYVPEKKSPRRKPRH